MNYIERTVNSYDVNSDAHNLKAIRVKPSWVKLNDDKTILLTKKCIKSLKSRTKLAKDFWKDTQERFPSHLVSGGCDNTHTIDEADRSTWNTHRTFGIPFLHAILDKTGKSGYSIDVLEIGPGYGNFMKFCDNQSGISKYRGLDINKLIDDERVFEGDGKTIHINGTFDVVYSINVFQHLTKKQRTSYFKEIFNKLNSGGVFIVSLFVKNAINERFFGLNDVDGNTYSIFLNQLIKIPTLEQIHKEFAESGLMLLHEMSCTNTMSFMVKKC